MANTEFKTGVIKPVEVYREAWEMIKGQFWMVWAVTVVGILIGGVVPIVLMGPMMCGIYLVLLQTFEGRTVDFAQLFKGFDYFLPGLIVSLFVMVPTIILIFSIYVPMFALAIAGPRMSESEVIVAVAGIIVVEVIIALIMVCLHTLLYFAFPLIVDRKLSAMDAVKTSARAVWHNLSGIVGMFVVAFGLALVGYAMLCIGIYLVLPLLISANAVAYRKVFPAIPEYRF
jgi:uncharacterized membrane protein